MDRSRIIQPIGDRIIIPKRKMWMGLEDRMPPRMLYPKLSKKSILSPGSSGGSASPSGGATGVLVGRSVLTDTTYRDMVVNDEWIYFLAGYTASATGSANMARVRLYDWNDNVYIKVAVWNSSKVLLGASNSVLLTGAGVIDLAIASPISITNGQTYYLAIATTVNQVTIYCETGGSYVVGYDTTGSYASPPNPLPADATGGYAAGNTLCIWLEAV